ncbi:MAG TPA: hypothetical protein VFF03_01600 [Rhodocyclaceae bacterium]|nr:hypothetical protein [Rhodocyclaceae bacterium]
MSNESTQENSEQNVQSILEWLALAPNRSSQEDAIGLKRRLATLRTTLLPAEQKAKLLDMLYAHAAKITAAQLPALQEITLPVSRRTRQLVRAIQDSLEILAQEYLESFTGNTSKDSVRPPVDDLCPAAQCLSWHMTISHLVAAPTTPGIWQLLHAAFRIAHDFGVEAQPSAPGTRSIEHIYLASLLLSVVQPASFTSLELEFIGEYIERCADGVKLTNGAPSGRRGVFWIDQERDAPPNALNRRLPPPETPVLYLVCDSIAHQAEKHLNALESGRSPTELNLPAFAGTPAGLGVLKRLGSFWGHPAKRRFPRRRQSYRADLCAGFDQLLEVLAPPSLIGPATSEWMITNESPDGYAMMHVSGATEHLRIGDIVALHPRRKEFSGENAWQICMVRWALSENPEHIELGLQVLSTRGIPATLTQPRRKAKGGTSALLLPKAPPLRPSQALVVPTGTVDDHEEKLIVVTGQDNVAVLELRATYLDERTSCVEVFSVEPDERP